MNMEKLSDKILNYCNSSPARFHMPGHKGFIDPHDITELSFSDNLHAPTGAIKELEAHCARTYSADGAFLLVNGSTCGVTGFHIALKSRVSNRPPRVVLGRDAHRSSVFACALSGAHVLGVDVDGYLKPGVIRAQDIEEAIDKENRNSKARLLIDAICITSPNYYGMCADIEAISRLSKKYNALLFVDCAHGAHFPFSERLPDTPSEYADAFVVSTHKTLCALNQTALLLTNGNALKPEAYRNALSMVQTTSPSYPLMLSVERAIQTASDEWERHITRILGVRERLIDNGMNILNANDMRHMDVSRLCISSHGLAKDGFELYRKLECHGIYAEMADMYYVVLITTPADEDIWYDRLIKALNEIRASFNGEKHDESGIFNILPRQDSGFVDVRRAMLESDTEHVPLERAVGRIAASAMGIYPPGSSFVLPGECISEAVVDTMRKAERIGASLFGVFNDNCVCVR